MEQLLQELKDKVITLPETGLEVVPYLDVLNLLTQLQTSYLKDLTEALETFQNQETDLH